MYVIKFSAVPIGMLMLVLTGPVWANVGDQVVDGVIPAGTATLDGDLNEWTGAVWRNVDQSFAGDPNLLDPDWDAEWTARWSGDTIYLAVRVTDGTPAHTDDYISFFESDVIEIYSRGSGISDGSGGFYAENTSGVGYGPAQQYVVGITDTSLDSGGGDSWQTLGAPPFVASFPDSRDIVNDGSDALTVATSATGSVGGPHTLIYEVAIRQYNTFDESDPTDDLRTLGVGDTVGFSVAAANISIVSPATTPDIGDYAGAISAGGGPGIFNMFDGIGLYQLVTDLGDFDADTDVDGFDFLQWQRGESPLPSSASDLSDWEGNFGVTGAGPLAGLAANTAAVPEPSTAVLFSLALAGLAANWRRRK